MAYDEDPEDILRWAQWQKSKEVKFKPSPLKKQEDGNDDCQ